MEKRIFNYLDAELGIKRTVIEARNYSKLILSLRKSSYLGNSYAQILQSKADRFIDKKSIAKEKD